MPRFRLLGLFALLLSVTVQPARASRVDEAQGGPVVPAVCAGPVMHLEPGVRKPDGSLDPGAKPPPADMPLDPVLMQVPRYPGASPSQERLKNPDYAPVLTAYLKTAVMEDDVPASLNAATNWYTKSFTTCGYLLYSRSVSSGPQGASSGIRFRSPTTPNMYIALSFQKVSANDTLLLYYAYAVTLPPRPRASVISLDQKRVKVTYAFPDGHHRWIITISNRSDILAIVNPIGSLQTIDAIAHTCFSSNHGEAKLVFTSSQGKHTTVLVLPGCEDLRIGHFPLLVDDNHGVWSAVSFVVYKYCLSHRCTKTDSRA